MITNLETIKDLGHKVMVVNYDNPRDLIKQRARSVDTYGGEVNPTTWSGGTVDYFERGLRGQVLDFVDAAADKVTQFGNVALQDYAIDFEYNLTYGVLDYGAMMAGNPACMYGATVVETDRSPIDIYIDPWVRGEVSASVIAARGVGILALVQALSVLRPVNAYILKGSHHNPAKTDTIQTLQIPTAPMDIARASFILCSPTVNRQGFLNSIHAAHKTKRHCSSPPMNAARWQRDGMPKWMAERNGVRDYLHLTGMFDAGMWGNDERVIAWIKEQIAKFVEINS